MLGGIFFGTNLLAALSFLGAPAIARRFGLLKTMVFSHLPSNVLLLLVPLMPTLQSAVAMLLARNLLSQLDVPTRQSYTMAVVHPEERAASAGILSVYATRVRQSAVVYGTYSSQSGARAAVSTGWWVEDSLRLVDLRRFPKSATGRRRKRTKSG
jgi:hypothetical protein